MKPFLAEDLKKLPPRTREMLCKFRKAVDSGKLDGLTFGDVAYLVDEFENILAYVK